MRFGAIVVAALTVSLSALSAFAADPFVGTWKPNAEKWRLSPGSPERRKSEVIMWESAGKDQYRQTTTKIDGKPTDSPPQVWIFDGNEHKFDDGRKSKTQRLDERHLRATVSSSKGTGVFDYVVSADGKTLTITRKGTATQSGRSLDELLVYDKQPANAK